VSAETSIVPVIPVYQPEDGLPAFVETLLRHFARLIVVDDGSTSPGAERIFARLAARSGVTLLRHRVNRGKGAALKTAFAHPLCRAPGVAGVVTVDADGQHLPADILRVAAALRRGEARLVLGTRTFDGEIPFRSRFGNLWTRWEFFLLTGVFVADTQTGLRGLPASWLAAAATLPGERYEYESRLLVHGARARVKPLQIPIATVYRDGNRTSHFRPLADTLLTQAALFAARVERRIFPRG
jgi:glycosyltransferase involved in cell wall biosynthesis